MNDEIDDIDLIIRQKLVNSSLNVPKDEWKLLDRTLSFRNFCRFSLNRINIYYVSIFSILLFSVSAQFVQNYRLKAEIKKMEILIRNKANKSQIINLPVHYEKNNLSIELKKSNQHSLIKNKNTVIQKSISKKPDDLIKDSTKMSIQPDIPVIENVNKIQQKNIKIVKKTIYIKRSPVIIRDTIIKYK
jgi:hypothetical protein